MKSNHISDPIVVEIYRVEKGQASIDSKKRQWVGVDLIQDAMLSYEPDLYHPEILIKTSMDSPLIRNKIEELDVEEWQNTTALFAEIFHLDFKTKNKIKGEPPLNRSIILDQESGKLVSVALTGRSIPNTIAVELLEKAFKEKSFKKPIVLHQAPITYKKTKRQLGDPDKSTSELLGAIENYILQTIQSKAAIPNKKVDTINLAFANLKQKIFNQPQTVTDEEPVYLAPPARTISPGPRQTLTRQLATQVTALQPNSQPLTMNNANMEGPDTPMTTNNVSMEGADTQVAAERTSEEWFKLSSPMNWKQRKNRDRNIVDLTERMIRLSKRKDHPPKEMIVSFLASLGTAQYEFIDTLVNCFTTKASKATEVPPGPESNQEPLSINDESTNHEQKTSDVAVQQSEISVVQPVKEEPTLKESAIIKEVSEDQPMKEEPVLIESAIADESILIDSEMEEFKDITEEEKELHFQILDYQKKHNVSYDHAASMVLK